MTSICFLTVNTNPPAIAGIDIKKENSAARSAFNPLTNPEAMVDPDREIPGKMAKACPTPIIKELFQPTVVPRPRKIRGTNKINPVTIRRPDTKTGFPGADSKKSLNIKAAKTAGTVATPNQKIK